MSAQNSNQSPLHYSLGIIGHRDLREEDMPRIREAVAAWLDKHQGRFGTTGTEVWTNLAFGIDQQVAWWLTHPDELSPNQPGSLSRQWALKLVLPFVESDYRGSTSAGWINHTEMPAGEGIHDTSPQFEPLYQTAVYRDFGSVEFYRDPEKYSVSEQEAARAAAYQTAARKIIDECDVLLVLWDGIENGKPGGTADSVQYALSRQHAEKRKPWGRPPIELHRLTIPRASNTFPLGLPYQAERLEPHHGISGRLGTEEAREELGKGLIQFLYNFKKPLWYFSLITFFGLLTICLGSYSLHGEHMAEKKADNVIESLIRAFSFMALEDITIKDPTPTDRFIHFAARASAVIFTFLLGVGLAAYTFGESLLLWRNTYRGGHYVVIGLGRKGTEFLKTMTDSSKRVVAIDREVDGSLARWCSEEWMSLIVGDATSPETLKQARLDRCEKVFIFCGDDQVDMQIASIAARMTDWHQTRNKLLTCNVALKNPNSFGILRRSIGDEANVNLRILDAKNITARMLLERYPIDRFEASPEADCARVVIFGDSPMARELLNQAMQVGLFEYHEEEDQAVPPFQDRYLRVTLLSRNAQKCTQDVLDTWPIYKADPDPSNECTLLRPNESWVRAQHILPDISVYGLPASHHQLLDDDSGLESCLFKDSPGKGRQVISIYFCMDDETETVTLVDRLAVRIERLRLEHQTDLQLYFYGNTSDIEFLQQLEHSVNESNPHLPIKGFEDFLGDYCCDAIEGVELDDLAIRINGMYGSHKYDPMYGPDILPPIWLEHWRKTDEADKQSSRAAAAHAPTKLRLYNRLGNLGLDEKELWTLLYKLEHRRWCAEKYLLGFRPLVHMIHARQMRKEEACLVADWFGWGGTDRPKTRDRWKEERRHVDLVPRQAISELLRAAGDVLKNDEQYGAKHSDWDGLVEHTVKKELEKDNLVSQIVDFLQHRDR